jgi:hypothetical protein
MAVFTRTHHPSILRTRWIESKYFPPIYLRPIILTLYTRVHLIFLFLYVSVQNSVCRALKLSVTSHQFRLTTSTHYRERFASFAERSGGRRRLFQRLDRRLTERQAVTALAHGPGSETVQDHSGQADGSQPGIILHGMCGLNSDLVCALSW